MMFILTSTDQNYTETVLIKTKKEKGIQNGK